MNAEEDDEIHARKLAERLREDREPLCPQLRACRAERLYPVHGYCVLAESPGWFMVPSTEEYREYCTTPRFGDCCWFRGRRENPGSVENHRGEDPVPRDAGQPQDVVQPALRKRR
jgi:hypothetical protein